MRTYPRCGLLILGFCFLSLASCVDSENPLSDPAKAQPATDLSGVWRIKDNNGVDYYHVGLAGDKFPSGMMRLVIVRHGKNGELGCENTGNHYFFTTTLGERHFVNFTYLNQDLIAKVQKNGWKPDTFKEGFIIYEYKIDGDKLQLFGMDPERKASLINEKKLKGVIKRDKKDLVDTILFQESSDDLAKFILSPEAEKLFQPLEEMKLERLK